MCWNVYIYIIIIYNAGLLNQSTRTLCTQQFDQPPSPPAPFLPLNEGCLPATNPVQLVMQSQQVFRGLTHRQTRGQANPAGFVMGSDQLLPHVMQRHDEHGVCKALVHDHQHNGHCSHSGAWQRIIYITCRSAQNSIPRSVFSSCSSMHALIHAYR